VTNTLAYYGRELIMVVKSFVIQAPDEALQQNPVLGTNLILWFSTTIKKLRRKQ
jgi:hypothetical protein